MKIDKDKGEFLSEVIEQWQSDNLIDDVTANRLKQSYETKTFDWYRLAQYSFWVAMACGFISLGAFLIDDSVLNYLKKIYDTPDILISVLSAGLAVWLYFLGFRRKRKQKHLRFSNEAILFSAILLTANAIAYFGKTLDNGSGHFSILILISAIVYALIGYCYESKLTWVFALISLGTWFGTETGYLSRKDFFFLGMNYPLRFVAFGLVLTLASLVLCRFKKLSQFYEVTFISGMIYLFTSLWLLSVFGNYGTLEAWYGVKQISLFYFAIISSVCCVISIWIGLKYRNDIAREFGIVFLFLNLYTRYFEYFWDSWHKALFFLVLAASFWLIGRKAEKIWNLEFLK